MTIKSQRNQSWFYKNINDNDKPFARLTREKKTQIIRNERENVTTNLIEIKNL